MDEKVGVMQIYLCAGLSDGLILKQMQEHLDNLQIRSWTPERARKSNPEYFMYDMQSAIGEAKIIVFIEGARTMESFDVKKELCAIMDLQKPLYIYKIHNGETPDFIKNIKSIVSIFDASDAPNSLTKYKQFYDKYIKKELKKYK